VQVPRRLRAHPDLGHVWALPASAGGWPAGSPL